MLPEYIEIETASAPTHSVVWLHGLGADGADFADLPSMLELPSKSAIRFIFPHAPIRPITLNGGAMMRGWYDLAGLQELDKQDVIGIRESSSQIRCLIEQEMTRGISSDQIFLGGFSQGGALALYLGLRYPEKLAGIIGLSTYLPALQSMTTECSEFNRQTPIFMAHGLHDSMIPLGVADHSRCLLEQYDYQLTWRTYPMQHSICDLEIQDLGQFISNCL